MKHIVPGGYYSYDSTNKKIWLSYPYYRLGLENIESIRNLTRGIIYYHRKNSNTNVTCANGCITHTCPCIDSSNDKIQIVLRTPILDSLEELEPVDGVVTVETAGKVLVLPTGNASIIPCFNEYTLSNSRLTLAESPFGGFKGTPADYCPGTILVTADDVYLTDIAGQNSSKVLGAGKLKELGLLSVDTTAHTITEEFIVKNDGTGTDVQVIDACDALTGWSIYQGSGGLSINNSKLTLVGKSDPSGYFIACKTFSARDLSSCRFLKYLISSSIAGNAYWYIGSSTVGSNCARTYPAKSYFSIPANTEKTIIAAFKAPQSASSNANPASVVGTPNWSAVTTILLGVHISPYTDVSVCIDDIIACNAPPTQLEFSVPDNLSPVSIAVYTHNGTAYQLASTHSLDSTYALVAQTSANFTSLDSTKFDDVYGTGLGRVVFPKGSAGESKTGSSGTITYSTNTGTSKRIGLKINLPPSDNGRTNFNKCRIKTILYYTMDTNGVGSASYDFADSTNASYGLQNVIYPWVAILDESHDIIDFYLPTHRFKNLSFKRNESGQIYELSLYSGNGLLYHGQISYTGLTTDSDSNNIPDCLEEAVNGSITQFLKNYEMVID